MKFEENFKNSIFSLIKKTSVELPLDIKNVLMSIGEDEGTASDNALKVIRENIKLAESLSRPLCQDTGTLLFYVRHSSGISQMEITKCINAAVISATKSGLLRANSVDSISGKNSGTNIGRGHPTIHFMEYETENEDKNNKFEIKLILKGGGCENVGVQYSLPDNQLNAGRDLDGVRKVILDAVCKAQGLGCSPGVLGVCIGGDRGAGYQCSKEQFLRKLDDKNKNCQLDALEKEIVESANSLGIGVMGFGGRNTLLGCKIGVLDRIPASYFVSVSYMCWAFRRQGIKLDEKNNITGWC